MKLYIIYNVNSFSLLIACYLVRLDEHVCDVIYRYHCYITDILRLSHGSFHIGQYVKPEHW